LAREEILYFYDGRKHKLGSAPRSECHAKNLLHRAVAIVLKNSKGRLFLQMRSAEKELYPGQFTASASGHVASGEGLEETALRELEEELGVEGVKLKREFEFVSRVPGDDEIITVFSARYDGAMHINAKEASSCGSRFYSLGEIRALPESAMAPHLVRALKRMKMK